MSQHVIKAVRCFPTVYLSEGHTSAPHSHYNWVGFTIKFLVLLNERGPWQNFLNERGPKFWLGSRLPIHSFFLADGTWIFKFKLHGTWIFKFYRLLYSLIFVAWKELKIQCLYQSRMVIGVLRTSRVSCRRGPLFCMSNVEIVAKLFRVVETQKTWRNMLIFVRDEFCQERAA